MKLKQTLTLSQLQDVVANLAEAVDELKARHLASTRITHSGNPEKHFLQSLNVLETELCAQRALLRRVEVLGR